MGEDQDAQKDYRWISKLVVPAFKFPEPRKTKGKKVVEANLLVGEWVKHLEDVGEREAKVKFRGGEGFVPRDSLGMNRLLEIYFIDVGQGDSILIQTPDDKRVLIDGGGDDRAHNFLDWKYNLEEHEKEFEAVILTHGDADHIDGLINVLNDEKIMVKSVYHNGIAKWGEGPELGKTIKVDGETMLADLYNDIDEIVPRKDKLTNTFQSWVDAITNAKTRAQQKKVPFKCVRVDQNTPPLVIGDRYPVEINFLNPINFGTSVKPCLKKFGDTGETINGNSVGVLMKYRRARFLFCGDMNADAEENFMAYWKKSTRAHVFKANHHGSPHFSTEFLRGVKPWITVVSSGDTKDYGHPRANLLGSLGHYAPKNIKQPLLFSTEIAATFKKVKKPKRRQKQLYEKTIHGLINLRSNGRWIAAGRVYQKKNRLWKWENYAFDLKTGGPLYYDLKS